MRHGGLVRISLNFSSRLMSISGIPSRFSAVSIASFTSSVRESNVGFFSELLEPEKSKLISEFKGIMVEIFRQRFQLTDDMCTVSNSLNSFSVKFLNTVHNNAEMFVARTQRFYN